MRAIVFVAALAISAPALAASKWITFYTANNGAIHSIDAASMKLVRKGVWKIWVKTDTSKVTGMKSASVVRQVEINCTDQTMTLGSGASYGRDGSTSSITQQFVPTAIIPDTVGSAMADLMCEDAPSPS